MKCAICGCKRLVKLRLINEISRYDGRKYPLYKCLNCGFTRPFPLPYENSTKGKIYDEGENIKFYNKKEKKIEEDSNEYKYYFKHFKPYLEIIKHYKIKGKSLDVGCGVGHLLKLLSKKGFRAEGLDITPIIANALRPKFKVYCCEINNKKIKSGNYDLVSANQVLEHVEKPESFVKDCNRVLKKEGFFILAVPYIWGIVPKILRSYWYGLGYGQHLNFFTKKSMKILLERNGFKVEEFRILSVDYAHPRFPKILNMVADGLSRGIVGLGMGDNMYVIARKIAEVKK